jgi:hypothetical protein
MNWKNQQKLNGTDIFEKRVAETQKKGLTVIPSSLQVKVFSNCFESPSGRLVWIRLFTIIVLDETDINNVETITCFDRT